MGTSVVTAQNVDTLRHALEQSAPKFAEVLPPGITPERLIRMTLIAVSRNPEIGNCTRDSVLVAVMQIASWGLEIGRTAHLVPYGKTCTAIPDYKGLVQMAIQSDSIAKADARIVRATDAFEVEYGLTERCEHRPVIGSAEPVKAVYAVVKLMNGEQKFEVMAFDEVEAIRQRSKSGNNGPWKTDWSEMAKKTVVKRLLKMIPLSAKVADAIEADNLEYERSEIPPEEPISKATTGTARLAEKLASKAAAVKPATGPTPYLTALLARAAAGEVLDGNDAEEVRQYGMDHPEAAHV